MGATIKYLRRTTSGAADNGLGTAITYLSGAAGTGLGFTIKYLRGAVEIGLGSTIKYLRRTTRQRPWYLDQVPATHNKRRRGQSPEHHDQVPATYNERRCKQRSESMPGITDVPVHHKRRAFASC
jgi:hypothetical protein